MLGHLYVFEGCDGSGKTTIARRLCDLLRNGKRLTNYFAFPGQTEGTLGKHIHQLHHDPDSQGIKEIGPESLQVLHIAAHIEGIQAAILPALRRGECVVLDRYWWSTWAYGVATGVDRRALRIMVELELLSWKGISPKAVFLIERAANPGHDQGMPETKIWAEYKQLVSREREKYSIHLVKNQGPIDATLKVVLALAGL